MKILVLHGSPKGEDSVTMQYSKFLMKKFPEHEWGVENVGSMINVIEKDSARFDSVIDSVRRADFIIWSFPVYVLLVPYQIKRFIELVYERNSFDAFNGKYAAAIMTSIHYQDHIAKNYIHAVSEDLGMNFCASFTPEMNDLMKEKIRKGIVTFAKNIFSDCELKNPVSRAFNTLKENSFSYNSIGGQTPVSDSNARVRIIYDSTGNNSVKETALQIAARFSNAVAGDLAEVNIKGGCLGCLRCGLKSECIYDGSDDYRAFHQKMILDADIVFFVGEIRDRYLSSRFKMFFDRSFYRNHMPSLSGKQTAWVVVGELSAIPNIRQFIEAYSEVSQANIAGIVSSESNDPQAFSKDIDLLVKRAAFFHEEKFLAPDTFLGNGGRRIFRDEIWGFMRIIFSADYKFYKKNKMFDFPTKKLINKTVIPFASRLMRIPALRNGMNKNMKKGMIAGLSKIVKEA
ncbi:MAG TPA: NAD(P)H-dependent oxidoreductase [Spirochaetota bacterium]|nr:NAD(P)H-dependent oxidoreductase [Spirochaetota bacterium]HOR44159.1 NAD(P)H-dependent oxidoreductase [Spirochaetota bacterium]HPK55121.1 NAD(P)H-dependent oxidoreductase [Spirochaetota bacterium]